MDFEKPPENLPDPLLSIPPLRAIKLIKEGVEQGKYNSLEDFYIHLETLIPEAKGLPEGDASQLGLAVKELKILCDKKGLK